MKIKTTTTGFIRIGKKESSKKALESYWAERSSLSELKTISSELRKRHWQYQKEYGIDLISCNDFSWYDNMLDTAVMLSAIPERFKDIENKTEQYFAMVIGNKNCVAMEMTKWFNTNYHYIVPELSKDDEYN
ncbi:MAG TPA: hypothetical protein DCK79_08935 [Candidatus Atribacteria bacterium]|jgi:5-methyltetrahydropteroyltriglutamate--homocysteine methyltransferase|nr:hypothetical protein [Candidatus Atribacteria bacterium]